MWGGGGGGGGYSHIFLHEGGGGGQGTKAFIFSSYVGSGLSIYRSPKKISGISSTAKNI